jgi:hypothetical protein
MDAKSTYTNINTPTKVAAVRDFVTTNKKKLPHDFPASLFLHIQ